SPMVRTILPGCAIRFLASPSLITLHLSCESPVSMYLWRLAPSLGWLHSHRVVFHFCSIRSISPWRKSSSLLYSQPSMGRIPGGNVPNFDLRNHLRTRLRPSSKLFSSVSYSSLDL